MEGGGGFLEMQSDIIFQQPMRSDLGCGDSVLRAGNNTLALPLINA